MQIQTEIHQERVGERGDGKNTNMNTNTNTITPGEIWREGGWQPGESSGEPEVMTRTTLSPLMRTPIHVAS